ncbi:MAG TPA: DinB family protein [Pyrinomonadaceae bacterium]|nr:DinB family protein [Pyrinomonadaceae bacterium]
MKPFLDSPDLLKTVTSEAEKNNDTARVLTSDLTEGQLNWKPSAGQWSMAQCLEHLAVATKGFEKYFDAALELAEQRWAATTPPKYKPTILGGWLAKQVSPEGERKLPAPKIFRPAESSNIEGSVKMFLDQQVKFVDFVRRCEGIDYNKTRLRSPVTPLIRYSLADAFVITVLHAQRHLAQARRVRERPEFPSA